MPTTIGNLITLDGQFADWPLNDVIMGPANTVAGYQVYGALLNDATSGNNYVIGINATVATDPVIAANTFIYLNTDQNKTTGYTPFGSVGAEYYVQFSLDSNSVLQPYLYAVTSGGAATQLNGGAPLNFGASSDGESVEIAVPQTLLIPSGGTAPSSINFAALINNGAAALPGDFASSPQYTIVDPATVTPPTTIGNLITLDGQFADWPAADAVERPGNTVTNYQLYGALITDATSGKNYVIGIEAAVTTDPAIAANTFIYLNTDQNTATGYTPFGSVGAEYYVQFSPDTNGVLQPYLYAVTSTGVATQLNGGAPLHFGTSSNGESIEIAIPQALLTPSGGAAPTSINFSALINNGAAALPGDFSNNPQYVITDPSTLVPVNTAIKKVGIVYSATTAALYFGGGAAGQTAYADLFMAAQHQASAAGVSYDLLSEADLTNVAKLSQYSALIFPSMEDVQSSQVSAIVSALSHVVYDYHVPIITAGNFLTNDQTGAPLSGNSYANMQALLNVTLNSSGTATYSVTADATALANHNPIVAGYAAGELIGGASGQFAGTTAGYYTNTGYLTFSGVTQPATVLADINIQGGATVAGVVQTTTGATNTVFATTGLLGDSNLLQHAIQNAVFGTTPSLSLDITRMAGVFNSRTDMDQSQFPSDVSPGAGQQGIYDALIPILQQWKQQYGFVGSYFINIGDNANPDNANSTNWAVSAAYYKAIIAMGSEIGNHSYTHLINPPTIDANGNPVPTTVVNGVTTSTWDENTNTLYVTAPANGSGPNWTFAYEFGQSKTIEGQNIGITIAGAAVPGANETMSTSQQIMQYYQTVAGGLTGYLTGGWTGVGSGSPNAFGYMTPTDTGSVYIAPNITFDFTEIQFQNKTPEQALADWALLFNQLSANSETPVIVWPWHDYGPTNWDTSGTGANSGYNAQMFTDFIAYAYNAGYEFLTSEDLAARIAAQQKATLSETTSGNVITATITPDPSAPDLGAMALNVTSGTTDLIIQNAGTWYAYDSNSIFLPSVGGTFTVTLGTSQDDVTHINSLPMRADLRSVTGDGMNLAFSMTGDGEVDIHVQTTDANIVSIQGAPAATLFGADLALMFNDGALAVSSSSPVGVPVLHNVTVSSGASAVASSGADIIFGGSADDTINGGAGNDILYGRAGNDTLSGAGDNDILTGGEGNDTLDGGTGTNTANYSGVVTDYIFTLNGDGSVTVADQRTDSSDGTDTDINIQNYQFGDGAVLTQAQLPFAVIMGTAGNDTLTGSATANPGQLIQGLGGNDTLTAGTGGNTTLDGGDGDDTLRDAGVAAAASIIDTMIGGAGNDTYVVTRANDVIVEQLNGGTDVVSTNLSTYLLPDNVENFVYTGTTGVTATGNALANTFSGGAGNDTFNGGGGNDTLNGGTGTNTAIYSGLITDYGFTLNANGSVTVTDLRANSPDGTDTDTNIQNYQFGNGAVLTQAQLPFAVITGTAGNDTLTGSATANSGQLIQGLGGNDTLTAGTGGNTTLDGGDNDDTLRDAGVAAAASIVDTMIGGAGNDTYVVTRANDVIVEQLNGGTDVVSTNLSAYLLADNVENFVYTGTTGVTATGNALANTFSGFKGTSALNGGDGTDTAIFTGLISQFTSHSNPDGSVTLTDTSAGSPNGTTTFTKFESFQFSDGLVLTAAQLASPTIVNGTTGNDNSLTSTISGAIISGLAGNDTLTAGANNQVLDGGAGTDSLRDNGKSGVTLFGGADNDTYVVSVAGTVVTELAGGGTDTVQTALTSYQLTANVENLVHTGSTNFTSTATAAGQSITGSTGADTLGDGGFASVTLTGGGGADTFNVTSASTVVTESSSSTNSSVNTTLASYTLPTNVQNLTYTGTAAFTGTGNTLGNSITGGAGNDTLSGGSGNDTLTGKAGNDTLTGGNNSDTFVFAPVNPTTTGGIYNAGFGKDVITDFSTTGSNHDDLQFSSSMFAAGTTASSLANGTAHNVAGGLVTVAQSGNNVVITLDPTDTITLNNVSLTLLKLSASSDIHFV